MPPPSTSLILRFVLSLGTPNATGRVASEGHARNPLILSEAPVSTHRMVSRDLWTLLWLEGNRGSPAWPLMEFTALSLLQTPLDER